MITIINKNEKNDECLDLPVTGYGHVLFTWEEIFELGVRS